VFKVLTAMDSTKLVIGAVSVALVFLVVVVVAVMAVASHVCPRSRRIVFVRDPDSSRIKQMSSIRWLVSANASE